MSVVALVVIGVAFLVFAVCMDEAVVGRSLGTLLLRCASGVVVVVVVGGDDAESDDDALSMSMLSPCSSADV